jgi:trigger factor
VAITKEITGLEKSNVRLSITVPKDDVRAKYDAMLREYSKELQIPGFRKGKVPKEVLERKFTEALKGDALGRIIESSLKEVFEDEKLERHERPLSYSTPELQDEPKLDLEQDLQFSVVYDVLPKINISQWKGLTVDYPYAEVEKEDIDRELEEIRERNAIVMDRDDGAAAQKGDVVTIDYDILDDNGESLPDLRRTGFTFTPGSKMDIFQFEEYIMGMKKGETKEFEKKFGDDNANADLAGKTRKVRLTVAGLKEKKLPDLDDDLAQDVDEKFNTLDDLKNSIKERLTKNLDRKMREIRLNELLRKIMENTPVVMPESLIQAEIESRWRRLANYYRTSVDVIKQLMINDNKIGEKENDRRIAAEKSLHSRMIIETLIEEQKMDVSDEDVEKEMEKLAEENNLDIEEIRKEYNEQNIFYLKEEIMERRITDILLSENTLNPGKKENYLDFMSDNG